MAVWFGGSDFQRCGGGGGEEDGFVETGFGALGEERWWWGCVGEWGGEGRGRVGFWVCCRGHGFGVWRCKIVDEV